MFLISGMITYETIISPCIGLSVGVRIHSNRMNKFLIRTLYFRYNLDFSFGEVACWQLGYCARQTQIYARGISFNDITPLILSYTI